MVQQKLTGRDYEFQEHTLRRESFVKRENPSGESHDDREEFRLEESEDDVEARKEFRTIQGDFIYCHHTDPRVQLTCQEKNHYLLPRFILLKKKYTISRQD